MTDVFVSGVSSSIPLNQFPGNEVEFVQPVIAEAIRDAGLTTGDIQFTTASSSDSFAGQAFAFVRMLDASGAYPAIEDSHLDMDGAWALYEAWVRLQVGDISTALVFALGRSSSGRMRDVSPHTLDPYYLAPLGLHADAVAALQLSRMLEEERTSAGELDEIAVACAEAARAAAEGHGERDENCTLTTPGRLQSPPAPLRKSWTPPPTDGVCAMVLTTRPTSDRAVRIEAMQHRTDSHSPGTRDTTRSRSFELVLDALGGLDDIDRYELHARYPHELVLLQQALQAAGGPGAADVPLIPTAGGAMAADPFMASGLYAHAAAVRSIRRGDARRVLAHASSGPALQQNLATIFEVVR